MFFKFNFLRSILFNIQLSQQSVALKEGSTVSIVYADSPKRFFIRALADDDQYEKIGTTLAEIYAQETPPSALDSRVAIYVSSCAQLASDEKRKKLKLLKQLKNVNIF